jgi:hypothetical protein
VLRTHPDDGYAFCISNAAWYSAPKSAPVRKSCQQGRVDVACGSQRSPVKPHPAPIRQAVNAVREAEPELRPDDRPVPYGRRMTTPIRRNRGALAPSAACGGCVVVRSSIWNAPGAG